MCPRCIGNAVMMIAGIVSPGGLTALLARFQVWKHSKSSVRKTNSQEAT